MAVFFTADRMRTIWSPYVLLRSVPAFRYVPPAPTVFLSCSCLLLAFSLSDCCCCPCWSWLLLLL